MLMLGVAPWAAVLEVGPAGLVEEAAWVKLRLLPEDSFRWAASATPGGDPPAVAVEAFCVEDNDLETPLCSRLPVASCMVRSLVLKVPFVVLVIVISSVMESRL